MDMDNASTKEKNPSEEEDDHSQMERNKSIEQRVDGNDEEEET